MKNIKLFLGTTALIVSLMSFANERSSFGNKAPSRKASEYYINAVSNGDGSVTGSGMYADNVAVTIEAQPDSGFFFVNWSDGNTDNPRVLYLTRDLTLCANFDLIDRLAPDGLLLGVFSVGPDTYISFSQGNLQYKPYPGLWRFANRQYDYVGDLSYGTVYVAGTKCDNLEISNYYPGWLDLFGFGTGVNPTNTSNVNANYSTYNEWGNNTISNADNTYIWRTLTASEWDYLINSRSNASALYGQATIDGVSGLIILPDTWNEQCAISIVRGAVDFTANVFSNKQWKELETYGAV